MFVRFGLLNYHHNQQMNFLEIIQPGSNVFLSCLSYRYVTYMYTRRACFLAAYDFCYPSIHSCYHGIQPLVSKTSSTSLTIKYMTSRNEGWHNLPYCLQLLVFLFIMFSVVYLCPSKILISDIARPRSWMFIWFIWNHYCNQPGELIRLWSWSKQG